MNSKAGILYIVATPIGNLGDMTPRAVAVLAQADLVLAEDTRRASLLFNRFAIDTPVRSCHEHNERKQLAAILERLQQGQSIALMSDAGTPLISDPGYVIVHAARKADIAVTPIPGACALIAALCASGLPTDRFCFEGFLPAKAAARVAFLKARSQQTQTLIFYESSHRIAASLDAISAVMGNHRAVVVARELTKKFECFYQGEAKNIANQIANGADDQKGEFVIMVAGAPPQPIDNAEAARLLGLLTPELPLKTASKIAAKWLGVNRNALYRLGVDNKQ